MSYLEKYLPNDWGQHIDMPEIEFYALGRAVAGERQRNTVYPESKNMFKAFELTPFRNTKIVLLGQDPYHTKGHAYGVSFGTLSEDIPPSLKNIRKEIERSIYNGLLLEFDYSLQHWAKQGVLLLNTSLSVNEGIPGSHTALWMSFTEAVIKSFENRTNLIWILLGNHAKKYKPLISDLHVKLEAGHPSPLNTSVPFIGSDVFKKANDWLEVWGAEPIKW